MNPHTNVTNALGATIADVAAGRLSVDAVLACVERWASDMACRERAAIPTSLRTGEALILAIRGRGMHLAVLSLGVRLDLLRAGKDPSPLA
jgi:hypothetical protein